MSKKDKRLSEFQTWIQIFSDYHSQTNNPLIFIDNAAQILNAMYWRYVEHYIHPVIANKVDKSSPESKISRFKIISATELSIIDVQPIILENGEIDRTKNAEFAYFVATEILLVFSETAISEKTLQYVSNFKEQIEEVDVTEILSIKEEHLKWLANLDSSLQLPILSNAQMWRIFYFSLLALEGKLID